MAGAKRCRPLCFVPQYKEGIADIYSDMCITDKPFVAHSLTLLTGWLAFLSLYRHLCLSPLLADSFYAADAQLIISLALLFKSTVLEISGTNGAEERSCYTVVIRDAASTIGERAAALADTWST